MKVYDDKHIKNVVLIGETKCGKTTLAETMIFESGNLQRRGEVEAKNTTSDFHEIEHHRGHSVYATPFHLEWRDYKINAIDTPGSSDFIGEITSSLRVCDTCLMVLNAQNGMSVGSEIIWNYVDPFKRPTFFVVNQLDHPKAHWESVCDSLQSKFGDNAVLMQYPVNPGEGFNKIIDLVKMTMYEFSPTGGKPKKLPIPQSESEKATELRAKLLEKAAENDEKLMEIYFEKGDLDEASLCQGLKLGVIKRDLFPVFCVSAKNNMGTGRLMGFINSVAPSPSDMPPEMTEEGKEISCKTDAPTTLFVFKTLVEPFLGKVNFFKVCSGEMKAAQEVVNVKTGDIEKFTQLFIMDGNRRQVVDRMVAGDIGAVVKLKATATNQTLATKGHEVTFKPIYFPPPKIQMAVLPESDQDDDKISQALKDIHEEDPTLMAEFSRELKQLIVSAQGELHLDATQWKLEHLFKSRCRWVIPKIPYRETIQKTAQSMYRHKKQSGGAGQFGEVHIKVFPYHEGAEPPKDMKVRDTQVITLPWGGKLVFYNCIVGGSIDARFIPSILKGIMDKMEEGPLTGSYARDICVALYDGKMHPVDSNDISFKIAGSMAFKQGFLEAGPQILEPLCIVEVKVPEELVGDVMSDLQGRRSVIIGIDNEGTFQVVKARTPLAELQRYSTSLKQITQGRAIFDIKFAEYTIVPRELQDKLATDYQKQEQA